MCVWEHVNTCMHTYIHKLFQQMVTFRVFEMCVCVCVCVCVFARAHACVFLHMHVCTYVCKRFLHTSIKLPPQIQCTEWPECMYTYVRAACVYMHTYACLCMYECISSPPVRRYRLSDMYIRTHIHTCTYTYIFYSLYIHSYMHAHIHRASKSLCNARISLSTLCM